MQPLLKCKRCYQRYSQLDTSSALLLNDYWCTFLETWQHVWCLHLIKWKILIECHVLILSTFWGMDYASPILFLDVTKGQRVAFFSVNHCIIQNHIIFYCPKPKKPGLLHCLLHFNNLLFTIFNVKNKTRQKNLRLE